MSGPVATMTAPAVDTTSAAASFHRSLSTPDLLSELTKPPLASPAASSSSAALHRPLSLKSLPSLPAFDVPSFDLDTDLDSVLVLNVPKGSGNSAKRRAVLANEKAVEVITETGTAAAVMSSRTDKISRKKSLIDRPRSWLPSSRSSTNIRDAVGDSKRRNTGPSQDDSGPSGDAPEYIKPVERSRTVESFADFAKKSWMSRSRSPSPSPSTSSREVPTTAEAKQESGIGARSVSLGTLKLKTGLSPEKSSRKRTVSGLDSEANQSSESLSSTSRVRSRASSYLSRIKQRPQSVLFTRSSSSTTSSPLSLSPSASTISLGKNGSASEKAAGSNSVTSNPSNQLVDPDHLFPNNSSSGNTLAPLAPRNSSQTASSSASDAGTSSENASQITADTSVTMPNQKRFSAARDPLGAAFRNLDVEFGRFAAKNSTSARMAVVRASLVPFLRNSAPSSSPRNQAADAKQLQLLSPENVDHRATVLNKWWNGLLEMLDAGQLRANGSGLGVGSGMGLSMSPNGGGQPASMLASLQPVAGVDRPALLEATTMIMMRPEWRVLTSYFQPLSSRSPRELVRSSWAARSSGSDSDDVTDSALLAESAEHHVRTMFVTNLLTQMAIVVDKLSLRHAPLSVVNFAGKACAYAFFFAPGVADVLVRLWGLPAELMRRVADEYRLPRRSRGESDDIVALFPPNLGELGWTSPKIMADKLRLAAKLPLLTAKIPWHGPWVARWRGGDTDLFFIFSKYFHVLADEFMPADLPLLEKARAPAFLLVHAQLLSTLDSTIHRHAAADALINMPLADALTPDAALTHLPMPPPNMLKGMAENRLLMLLRDMLSDGPMAVLLSVRYTFAEALMGVIKAATRRVSRYETTTCYLLCDFLEEAILTYDGWQNTLNSSYATSPAEETAPPSPLVTPSAQQGKVNFIDWEFWTDIAKLLLNSNNTMSEVRVLSFIYTIWDAMTADPIRKEVLLVNWLLTDEVFDKFFNSWCPMVRTYFMRLLCWRICRDSGSANELDVRIFMLVSQRLKTVWAHYLWLKQAADMAGKMQPSTAPSLPAPGKRMVIIRNEVVVPQGGLMSSGFDSFAAPATTRSIEAASSADSRADGANSGNGKSDKGNDGNASSAYRKKWTLLGKVLSFTAAVPMGANTGAAVPGNYGAYGRRPTWEDDLEQTRRNVATSRSRSNSDSLFQGNSRGPPPPPKQNASSSAVTPSSDSGSSTGSSPVFDAVKFVFRFTLQYQGPGNQLPPMLARDRILARPRLPAPAQARVSARTAALKASSANSDGPTATGGAAVNPAIALLRDESPPPPSPGLPPATRRFSGLMQTGLVSEAKNARPLEAKDNAIITPAATGAEKRLSLNVRRWTSSDVSKDEKTPKPAATAVEPARDDSPAPSLSTASFKSAESGGGSGSSIDQRDDDYDPEDDEDDEEVLRGRQPISPFEKSSPPPQNIIQPVKPTGIFAGNATYTGRALAEWSTVINECNSFIDRRRDEGVLGLGDIEVPLLSVEGFGAAAAAVAVGAGVAAGGGAGGFFRARPN